MKKIIDDQEMNDVLKLVEGYHKVICSRFAALGRTEIDAEFDHTVWEALCDYDETRGASKKTYVIKRVGWKFNTLAGFNHDIPISKDDYRMRQRIEQIYMQHPSYTAKQVADALGISERTVISHQICVDAVSMSAPIDGADDLFVEDTIADETPKPLGFEAIREMNDAKLSEREKDILLSAFGFNGDEESLESIGKRYGISHTAVAKIREKALRKLASSIGPERLEYLHSRLM